MTTDFSLHEDADSCPIKEPIKCCESKKSGNYTLQETTSSPPENGWLGD